MPTIGTASSGSRLRSRSWASPHRGPLRNCPEFVDLYGAAAWLGAILVPINWRLSADEIAYIVGDAAPKLVVADAAHHAVFLAARPEFRGIARWIGIGLAAAPLVALDDCFSAGAVAPPPPHTGDGALVMIYTAAVGGRPRGALVSQVGLLVNAMQAIYAWSVGEEDISYAPLPLFHIAGLNLLLTCLCAGAASVVTPRFEAEEGRLISAEKITLFVEFAPMLGALMDAAGDERSLASLRVVTGLDTPETITRFEAACPGARFYVAFGQTETSGFVTMAPFRERPGSAGRPVLMISVAVVDESDRPLPTGETGEIVVPDRACSTVAGIAPTKRRQPSATPGTIPATTVLSIATAISGTGEAARPRS